MSRPVQQHYLPKKAYLKFFEVPDKPGSIWLYQRSKNPQLTSINRVAKERHLYSFRNPDGTYNQAIEEWLAKIEELARPVLEKLNCIQEDQIIITVGEKERLARFIALQFVRTPGLRAQLQQQEGAILKGLLQNLAKNKPALQYLMEQGEIQRPILSGDEEISLEELQSFALEGNYDVKTSGDRYLGMQIDLAETVFPLLMCKRLIVLKVLPTTFITSDYPVVLVQDPNSLPYGGFLYSDILFPIGQHATLFLTGQQGKPPFSLEREKDITIEVRKIPPQKSRRINKHIVSYADEFIFSGERNENLKTIFERTMKPERFNVLSLSESDLVVLSQHWPSFPPN